MKKILIIIAITLMVVGIIGMYFSKDTVLPTNKLKIVDTFNIEEPYNNLDIKIEDGYLDIVPSKDNTTQLTIKHSDERNQFDYLLKDNTLFIKTNSINKRPKIELNFGLSEPHENIEMTLAVPNKKFKTFKAEALVGTINLNQLNTDTLDLKVSAGEIDANKIIAKQSSMTVGIGDIEIEEFNSKNLKVNVETGSVKLLKLNSDINITGNIDIGEGYFEYKKNPEQTHFDVESSIGEVDLSSLTNVAKNNAQSIVNIKVGVGSVTFE